jgi:polyisoprenoid-binding protein YceI
MLNRSGRAFGLMVAGMAMAGLAASALAGDPPAAASPSGKSLVIPDAQKKMGTVYYSIPEHGRQIYFISDAPAEKISGQSDKVIGYAIAGKDNPAALQGGEWHLPVKSLRSGNPTRDGHIASKGWLDAQANPDVIFVLKQVKDLKADKDPKTSTCTLVGEMTLHGITKPISISDATITMMPASDESAKIAKGNLMAIRANYPITLSDYKVTNQAVGGKVADQLKLETTLYMSTVPPEDQPASDSKGTDSGPKKKDTKAG